MSTFPRTFLSCKAYVSFYLIAILALRVKSHFLRNVLGNVLIVDNRVKKVSYIFTRTVRKA